MLLNIALFPTSTAYDQIIEKSTTKYHTKYIWIEKTTYTDVEKTRLVLKEIKGRPTGTFANRSKNINYIYAKEKYSEHKKTKKRVRVKRSFKEIETDLIQLKQTSVMTKPGLEIDTEFSKILKYVSGHFLFGTKRDNIPLSLMQATEPFDNDF